MTTIPSTTYLLATQLLDSSNTGMFGLLYWSKKCSDWILQLVGLKASKVDSPHWLYSTNHALFLDAVVGVVQ